MSAKHDEITEDEENYSTHSSAWTNKFNVTVSVAPRLICEDQLERRNEYYTNLEEKHKALEREKHEAEARKKGRRTISYKAHLHQTPPNVLKKGGKCLHCRVDNFAKCDSSIEQ